MDEETMKQVALEELKKYEILRKSNPDIWITPRPAPNREQALKNKKRDVYNHLLKQYHPCRRNARLSKCRSSRNPLGFAIRHENNKDGAAGGGGSIADEYQCLKFLLDRYYVRGEKNKKKCYDPQEAEMKDQFFFESVDDFNDIYNSIKLDIETNPNPCAADKMDTIRREYRCENNDSNDGVITQMPIPKGRGICVHKKCYDKISLDKWLQRKKTVPHNNVKINYARYKRATANM